MVVSACLLGRPVRYDGEFKGDPLIMELAKYVEVLPVCPETGIGLPSPRSRVFLWKDPRGEIRVIQEGTKKDLTPQLEEFCRKFLEKLKGRVKAFVLKSKSPSCSPTPTTKTYEDLEGEKLIGRYQGILGKMALELYPDVPILDENKLKGGEGRALLQLLFPSAIPDTLLQYFEAW